MKRTPVISRALVSVGYDTRRRTLEVELINGAIYQYFPVPVWEHERLLGAESKGIYYNLIIKERYQDYKLIRGPTMKRFRPAADIAAGGGRSPDRRRRAASSGRRLKSSS
jgi:KTSC domain